VNLDIYTYIESEIGNSFNLTQSMNPIFEKGLGRRTYAFPKYSTVKPVLSGPILSGHPLLSERQLESL